jgi:Toxin co-regulated pilus biosynthesis protein Q
LRKKFLNNKKLYNLGEITMKDLNMKKMTLIITGALSIISCQAVLAQEVANSNILVERTVAGTGKLTQVGVPSGSLPLLKGFAKDLPLITIMKQITPAGWVVKKDDKPTNLLDVNMSVSWGGGKTWIETLGSLVQDFGLNAQVDWNTKEIVLSPLEKVKNQMNVVAPTHVTASVPVVQEQGKIAVFEMGAPTVQVKQSKDQVAIGAPVVDNVVKVSAENGLELVPSWKTDTTLTLKENIEKWAAKVGYKVVWMGKDYPVDNEISYKGNFDSKDGPIKQIADDYGPKSRLTVPLSFQFYQNQTLVVENLKFEQAGFPQYTKK